MERSTHTQVPARSQVSVAGQVNYWLRVALFVGMGLAFNIGDDTRYTGNPSYKLVQDIMSMDNWGLLFIGFGAALAVSWWVSVRVARAALVAAGYVFLLWTTIYVYQAITDPRASTVAIAVYGFIAATSFGSTLYLRDPRAEQ